MRLVSFPFLPTTPKTPDPCLDCTLAAPPCRGLHGDSASTLQDPPRGTRMSHLAPTPTPLTKHGDIRPRAVPRRARPIILLLLHSWAWLGSGMDHGPARTGVPADLSVLGPGCGKGGRCVAAGGWTFSFSLSHPVQERPSPGLGPPVSPDMGTLLAWLPPEVERPVGPPWLHYRRDRAAVSLQRD